MVYILVRHKIKDFKKFAKSPKIPKDVQKKATVIGNPEGWFFEDVEKF